MTDDSNVALKRLKDKVNKNLAQWFELTFPMQ